MGLTLLPGGGAEQDPEDWWQAIAVATRHLPARDLVSGEQIAAICMSSQWRGPVPVDAAGRLRSSRQSPPNSGSPNGSKWSRETATPPPQASSWTTGPTHTSAPPPGSAATSRPNGPTSCTTSPHCPRWCRTDTGWPPSRTSPARPSTGSSASSSTPRTGCSTPTAHPRMRWPGLTPSPHQPESHPPRSGALFRSTGRRLDHTRRQRRRAGQLRRALAQPFREWSPAPTEADIGGPVTPTARITTRASPPAPDHATFPSGERSRLTRIESPLTDAPAGLRHPPSHPSPRGHFGISRRPRTSARLMPAPEVGVLENP